MTRMYNRGGDGDQVTAGRGAVSANPEGASPLYACAVTEARANQDQLFSEAFAVLQKAIHARVFPGASVAIRLAGKLIALRAFGRFTYDESSPAITTETIFDLASVTKVVATTSATMVLHERGLLDLEAPVVGVLAEFASEDSRRQDVTFRMLLAHSSGLPAYEKLFLRAYSPDALLHEAFKVELKYAPESHSE